MRVDMLGTEKFFKRKMPELRPMELFSIVTSSGAIRLFLRENSDSDTPSRVAIQLTIPQATILARGLLELAQEASA